MTMLRDVISHIKLDKIRLTRIEELTLLWIWTLLIDRTYRYRI